MPATLDFDQHLEALAASEAAFAADVESAVLEATVPTCPDWRVADLVAHQTKVHHWAAAVQLYLGLWNRGDEIRVGGDARLLDEWRTRYR
jgi:3-methyladenine DNA glycosylase AlkD